MKKIISIVIAITMLLSCFTMTSFAEENRSKISPTLETKIMYLPEEYIIETIIRLNINYDYDEAARRIEQKYGLTRETCKTIDDFVRYDDLERQILLCEMVSEANQRLIEKLGLSNKEVIHCGEKIPYVKAILTPEQIHQAVLFEEVDYIDYYSISSPASGGVGYKKISSDLQKKLNKISDDEKIKTCIRLYDIDENEVELRTEQECGLTKETCSTAEEINLYNQTYKRILGEMEAKRKSELIAQLGISEEDVNFCGTTSPQIIATLDKEQILRTVDTNEVRYMYEFSTGEPDSLPVPEPIWGMFYFDPVFLMGIRDYYKDDSIQKEDLKYEYKHFFHSPAEMALVKVRVNNYVYSDVETTTVIGNYVLKNIGPQPLLYGYDTSVNTLLTIEDAYNKGILDDDKLDEISRFEGVDLTLRYALGDADMDGSVSVLDATQIQRYKAEIISDDMLNLNAADVDKDGQVTVLDATQIQRYKAQLCNLDGSTPYTEALE